MYPQVNENGVISFINPWRYPYPKNFPTNDYNIRNAIAVAPFWSDNDIRKDGTVRYATYNITDRRPSVRALLNLVTANIQSRQGEETEILFEGTWMLIAHWDGVHPSPHGADDHGGIPEEELERVSSIYVL